MWIPRTERFYNEYVPQNVTHALGEEIDGPFPMREAALNQEPFPRGTVFSDVSSDSLYVIPRLENYADPQIRYLELVVHQNEESKP